MVVDDVLSGLDWATQRHVWKQVFSEEGILRKNGTTLVLTTHACMLTKSGKVRDTTANSPFQCI